ncbi:hypothetical protein RUESEDTHA_04103 [Ruegeria sp. THAF57]|uniref:hypothetical protein n=1 Tax=Ruegeria sp. THAF57 TaxID=2744555 RepID=UPI0015DED86A|nr:hypothetical protein [Ruegeria sp. THAF57]CAD0187191.1 hypothetical protein RUESEDTHA_04103 [Ruegeria sp. THAF57]
MTALILTQPRQVTLPGLMALALLGFIAKAGIELALLPDAMPYAAMSLRGAIANTGWYLIVAGLGQGAIFVMLMLLVWPGPSGAALLGGLNALWGANVIQNFDVMGLCLGGDLSPLVFAPSIPQTLAGAAIGAALGLTLQQMKGALS